MEDAGARIQKVSLELTVHIEKYTIYGSTMNTPWTINAGHSTTHSHRRTSREEYQYDNQSSLSTQEDVKQYHGLRGGDGSESEDKNPNVPQSSTPRPPNRP